MNAWTPVSFGPPNEWNPTGSCAAPPFMPSAIQMALTLYYAATGGQTAFPLSVADLFGSSWLLSASTPIAVYRNGSRLTPDNGTGVGAFTVDLAGNIVNLLWPAGAGEMLVIDIFAACPA